MNEIIDFFKAFLIPIIALIMVYIAYQQMKANKIKVKFDLYEDREKIYDATMNFISIIITMGKAERKDILDFLQKTYKSKFLLGKKVSTYLDILREKAYELLRLENMFERLAKRKDTTESEFKKISDKTDEIFGWFTKQTQKTEGIFKKYLDITKG